MRERDSERSSDDERRNPRNRAWRERTADDYHRKRNSYRGGSLERRRSSRTPPKRPPVSKSNYRHEREGGGEGASRTSRSPAYRHQRKLDPSSLRMHYRSPIKSPQLLSKRQPTPPPRASPPRSPFKGRSNSPYEYRRVGGEHLKTEDEEINGTTYYTKKKTPPRERRPTPPASTAIVLRSPQPPNSPKRWYSEEEVNKLLMQGVGRKDNDHAGHHKPVEEQGDKGDEWNVYKSKSTLKKERALRREEEGSSLSKIKGGCFNCGEYDHDKQSCPWGFVCYECKEADHLVAKCPIRAKARGKANAAQMKEKPKKKEQTQAHITVTPSMLEAKQKLKERYGFIKPMFGQPSADDIVRGLREISFEFKQWSWALLPLEEGYLAEFPSNRGIVTLDKIGLLKMKQGTFGIQVRRWTGEEWRVQQQFPVQVWIRIARFPVHCWELSGFQDLVRRFGVVIDIDPNTRAKSVVKEARIRIGCQSIEVIPNDIKTYIENQKYIAKIAVEGEDGGNGQKTVISRQLFTAMPDKSGEVQPCREPPRTGLEDSLDRLARTAKTFHDSNLNDVEDDGDFSFGKSVKIFAKTVERAAHHTADMTIDRGIKAVDISKGSTSQVEARLSTLRDDGDHSVRGHVSTRQLSQTPPLGPLTLEGPTLSLINDSRGLGLQTYTPTSKEVVNLEPIALVGSQNTIKISEACIPLKRAQQTLREAIFDEKLGKDKEGGMDQSINDRANISEVHTTELQPSADLGNNPMGSAAVDEGDPQMRTLVSKRVDYLIQKELMSRMEGMDWEDFRDLLNGLDRNKHHKGKVREDSRPDTSSEDEIENESQNGDDEQTTPERGLESLTDPQRQVNNSEGKVEQKRLGAKSKPASRRSGRQQNLPKGKKPLTVNEVIKGVGKRKSYEAITGLASASAKKKLKERFVGADVSTFEADSQEDDDREE